MKNLGQVIGDRIQGFLGSLCWDSRVTVEIAPGKFEGLLITPKSCMLENGRLVSFQNKTEAAITIKFTEVMTFGTAKVSDIPPKCSVTLRVRDYAPAVATIGFTVEGMGDGEGPLLGGKGPPGDSY